MRRFARLRVTELPTFRLAVNPTRAPRADVRGCGAACSTKPGAATLRPAATRRKSLRSFNVSSPGAKRLRLLEKPYAKSGHADKRLRPLANELARLVRAFHDRDPDNSITVEQTRLYSEPAQPGQRRLHGMRPTIRDVLVASGLSGGQGRAISGAVTSREVG